MKDGGRYIVLTPEELDALLEKAVVKGIMAARSSLMSRRQAEKEYGRATINHLIERGLIEGHRQGAASNSKVLFGREEIECAILKG